MFSIERLRPLLVQFVEDPALEQLLVGHADLDRVVGRAPFLEPRVDQRDVEGSTSPASPQIKRSRREVERNPSSGGISIQRPLVQQRLEAQNGKIVFTVINVFDGLAPERANWIDDRVEVEGRQVGIVRFHVIQRRMMIRGQCDGSRSRGVEVRKLDLVLRADLVADDDLVDVVELVPVVLVRVVVAEQRLELRAARDRQIQRLRREETTTVEEVEVVRVQ
mmetsp:Transcript_21507/g.56147  ORF Transcript_21507/g.56147 Transcript_21507/m.56147 type:complete len:221 (-) Transcript_21507:773-1435(-)